MDAFGGGIGVLLIATFELIALHWVYGVRRFSDDLKFMTGYNPSMFWKVCWVFIAPVSLIVRTKFVVIFIHIDFFLK